MQFNPRIVPCYSFLSDISPFRNLGWLPKFLNLFRDSSIKKIKNSSKFSIITDRSIKTLQYPPANYFTIEIKNYPYISPYRKLKNPFIEGNSITKVTRNEKRMKRNPASTPGETIGFRISAGPRKGEGVLFGCFSFGELSSFTCVRITHIERKVKPRVSLWWVERL